MRSPREVEQQRPADSSTYPRGAAGSGKGERAGVDQQGRYDDTLHKGLVATFPDVADTDHGVHHVFHPEREAQLRMPADQLAVLGPVGRVARSAGDEGFLRVQHSEVVQTVDDQAAAALGEQLVVGRLTGLEQQMRWHGITAEAPGVGYGVAGR